MKRTQLILLLLAAILLWAADLTGVEERLSQHRNLGKAFYENFTTHLIS